MNDTYFMEMALELARKGAGYTSPNPMVGAVVVKDGKVVGKGWHQKAGGPHAEVHAIDDAGELATDATIYVTLEPCNHTGKTPPCTEKILRAGIRRVVVAMLDPNPVAAGGCRYLKEQGLEVTWGTCRESAEKLNEFFIKYATTKRPFVVVKCAATLDGRIATRTGDSKWISGEESRHTVHLIRHQVDGIMVGVDTVKADNPSLTTRLEGMEGKDPVRIILDTRLTIPENAKVLQLKSDSGTLLVSGDLSSLGDEVLEKRSGWREPVYGLSPPPQGRAHRPGPADGYPGRTGHHKPAHRRGQPRARLGPSGRDCRQGSSLFCAQIPGGGRRDPHLPRRGPRTDEGLHHAEKHGCKNLRQ